MIIYLPRCKYNVFIRDDENNENNELMQENLVEHWIENKAVKIVTGQTEHFGDSNTIIMNNECRWFWKILNYVLLDYVEILNVLNAL